MGQEPSAKRTLALSNFALLKQCDAVDRRRETGARLARVCPRRTEHAGKADPHFRSARLPRGTVEILTGILRRFARWCG